MGVKRKVSEEEITQYLVNRAIKKANKLKSSERSSSSSSFFSNDSNPFGDANLEEKLVWRKKIERDIAQGLPSFSVKTERKKQRERMEEIEKVKKRRERRALEKQQHEEERELLARERARAEFQDWQKEEDEFFVNQNKMRSDIRLRQGRSKPIDILSNYVVNVLSDCSSDVDVELEEEPLRVFEGLVSVKEIEELRDEIGLNSSVMDEQSRMCSDYWKAILEICNWKIAEASKKDTSVSGDELLVGEKGLHSSVQAEVRDILERKTLRELEAMQSEIELQMSLGPAEVVEFWETVLIWLPMHKAKACLKEIHSQYLQKHLQQYKPSCKSGGAVLQFIVKDEVEEEVGSFSPQLLCGDNSENEVIDPAEDRGTLEKAGIAVIEERKDHIQEPVAPEQPPLLEKLNLNKAMGPMEEGDVVIGSDAEVNLDSQVEWWHDKYRPRKPKYFNAVHTGYEWSKYNRTHYDHDNPPPKIVRGYKFAIFYPELINRTETPTYTCDNDGNNGETCILRFHAGPPYEDIAFRIVNKDWDTSHKKGFKSTFDGGILRLHFHFRRYSYRR